MLVAVVQSLSPVQLCDPMCSTPGFPVLPRSLLKLLSIESNHLTLCHPLSLLPSIFPSIRVFSSELALHIRWPKYWNFSISPSNEYSGLISFRINLFDLFPVQGTGNSFKTVRKHPGNSFKTVRKHQFLSAQPSL